MCAFISLPTLNLGPMKLYLKYSLWKCLFLCQYSRLYYLSKEKFTSIKNIMSLSVCKNGFKVKIYTKKTHMKYVAPSKQIWYNVSECKFTVSYHKGVFLNIMKNGSYFVPIKMFLKRLYTILFRSVAETYICFLYI